MCHQHFWKIVSHFIERSILFTFRLYNTIAFCNYNWYVSIWSIKFVFPLTTCISVISSCPARRPWCSNSRSKSPHITERPRKHESEARVLIWRRTWFVRGRLITKILLIERVTHLHIAVPTKTRFYASRIHVLKNEKNLYIYLYMNK